MARPTDTLRGSIRRAIDAPVRIEIADTSAAQVMPIHGASLPGRMIDISAGGAQVEINTFLPRAARVRLELINAGGAPGLGLSARIMRVKMLDREPRYGVGLRFDEPQEEVARAFQAATGGPAE